jgi:hypothetical protein
MDHALLEAIAALRHAFDDALLERQAAVDERFQVDILGGDMSFDTSYSLPGEGPTPRVRADIGLEWPTWSQAAYRSWAIGEGFDEPPELILEVTLRLQRLVAPPDPRLALGLLPPEIHALGLGCDTLERAEPTVEQVYSTPPDASECSLEVTYDGALRLDEPVLESPEAMRACFAPLARWVASTLVRLGDLPLEFLPEEETEAEASD